MDVPDPLEFAETFWPHIDFYREQEEIIYSVRDNDETIVPAGNMLGKDFVAAFIALWFFWSRSPCRVVTTSVDGTQLEAVLWGEIRRFIQSAKYPLDSSRGGQLMVNHLHIRKITDGEVEGLSYLLGRVAAKGEGLLGHHIAKTGDGIPRTLFIADEASGVEDVSYERADTWADRKLIIGNPYPCTNFFFRGVRAGDLRADDNGHYYRKVIRIRGQDSPNVRFADAQVANGKPPSGETVIPGVLGYQDYQKRRATWDNIRQCIGLDAQFYDGAEVRLFPPAWLNRAEEVARTLHRPNHTRKTIGIDPAEGGDKSAWAVVDSHGLIELISMRTPDTSVIPGQTLALMNKYLVKPEDVVFDRGGGGKEHADRMRRDGHDVRTVAFGEAATTINRFSNRRRRLGEEIKEDVETRYVYRNRRAEMYGELRLAIDPAANPAGFGLPGAYTELREQLAPIPLQYDGEGRLELPPKTKKDDKSTTVTLTELIGHSPDEADAVALALHGLNHPATKGKVGGMW